MVLNLSYQVDIAKEDPSSLISRLPCNPRDVCFEKTYFSKYHSKSDVPKDVLKAIDSDLHLCIKGLSLEDALKDIKPGDSLIVYSKIILNPFSLEGQDNKDTYFVKNQNDLANAMIANIDFK